MKIFRPGLAPVYVDETPEKEVATPKEAPLPDVATAMALAAQRQGQVLEYTRRASGPSPLINADPEPPKAPNLPPTADPLLDLTSSGQDSERDPVDVELEALRAKIAALEGRPHSVNQHPEVSK